MNGKWLVVIIGIWLMTIFLGSTFDGYNTPTTWAGSGSGGYAEAPITTFSYLLNISNGVTQLPVLGGIPLPIPNPAYFQKLFQVITLQFSFVTGTYSMFYWIVLAPLAFAGILCLVLLFIGVIRGNITFG